VAIRPRGGWSDNTKEGGEANRDKEEKSGSIQRDTKHGTGLTVIEGKKDAERTEWEASIWKES